MKSVRSLRLLWHPVRMQKPLAREFEADGQETTADRDRRLEGLSKASKLAEKHWKLMAQHQKWDEVRADIVVYKYSGEDVKVDPRREDAYRQQVLDGLGFGKIGRTKGLTWKPWTWNSLGSFYGSVPQPFG